ncbi:P-loop containing nucleoside triphosphate hydrolase protein [Aspergillus karnatakaensis]|uniref:dynamin family protein n=1 Tax=Aspergillus karnatakaensis TaxID=1810916 RepID=UPI003CCE02E1
MATALSELDLQQIDTKPLFDAIDKLRRLRIKTNEIPIPQLLVVGEQSSGKSSVLESIAQISFPVGTGVCTRFPIELVMRRSSQPRLSIKIVPGTIRENDQAAIARMQAYHREVTATGDNLDISPYIAEASGVIGVPINDEANTDNGLHFTDDTLHIVHHGPHLVDLTLLDLPGIFTSPIGDQTIEDVKLVRRITKRYAQDPRSIILLVCSGAVDYATYTAPALIRNLGVKRIMGILTHLDVKGNVDQAEKLYSRQLEKHCDLGWHFLINRSGENPKKMSFKERDENERTIFENKFAVLPPDSWGVVRLREKLRRLLLAAVFDNLPKLIDQVKKEKERHRAEFNRLPPARTTEWEQRQYLLKQAVEFVALAEAASYPIYSKDLKFFGRYDDRAFNKRKLQATVREMNLAFSKAMRHHGPSTVIDDSLTEQPYERSDSDIRESDLSDIPEDEHEDLIENEAPSVDGASDPGTLDEHGTNIANDHQRDEEVTHTSPRSRITFLPEAIYSRYFELDMPTAISTMAYESELRERHREWLGKNPRSEVSFDFFIAVFHKQTERWDPLAKTHLSIVWEAVEDFIEETLNYYLPDQKQVRSGIKEFIIGPRLENLRTASYDRLEELLECHRKEGHVFLDTYPDFFPVSETDSSNVDSLLEWTRTAFENIISINDTHVRHFLDLVVSGNTAGLADYSNQFVDHDLAAKILTQCLKTPFPKPLIDAVRLVWNHSHDRGDPISPGTKAEIDAAKRVNYHQAMYYKMTVFSFVGYVNALIIEGLIMKGLREQIFTFDIVAAIDANTLQLVAGEPQEINKKRMALRDEIAVLEEVLGTLQTARASRGIQTGQLKQDT